MALTSAVACLWLPICKVCHVNTQCRYTDVSFVIVASLVATCIGIVTNSKCISLGLKKFNLLTSNLIIKNKTYKKSDNFHLICKIVANKESLLKSS